MIAACPSDGELVEIELGRLATQYRESIHLKGYIAAILHQVEIAAQATCAIPDWFDIATALGEQLTFLGRRMGFPRCHCVCDASPVYGIVCDGPYVGPPIAGLCDDASLRGCGGTSDLCIGDDEVYRAHLLARRYQMLGLYDIQSLGEALRHLWGPTAWVPDAKLGRVVIAPGRDLTPEEERRFRVSLRVLPIVPTMEIAVHYGSEPIAGIGTGWAGPCSSLPSSPVYGINCGAQTNYVVAGLCSTATLAGCEPFGEGGHLLCPVVVDPYACDDEPTIGVYGIDCGSDEGPFIAGLGDDNATLASCL